MSADNTLLEDFRALIRDENFDALEERWVAEIEKAEPESSPDISAFVFAADALLGSAQKGRADVLLDLTIPAYEHRKPDAKFLELLRRRCLAAPEDADIRSHFVQSFREVHGATSVEVEYLKIVDIERAADVEQAFASLDRWMALREGAWVFHPNGWGLGRILSIDTLLKQAIVDLEKKPRHRMAIEALGTVLEPLDEGHFLVLQREGGERIREMAQSDPVGLVETVLRSFRNPMPLKEIKPHLCPDFIDTRDWSRWWNRTKKLLRSNGFFRVGDRAPYLVEQLDDAVSYEDELLTQFESGDWSKKRLVAKKVLKESARGGDSALREAVVSALRRGVDSGPAPEAIGAAFLLQKHVEDDAVAGRETMKRAVGRCQNWTRELCAVEGAEEQRAAVAVMPEILGERWPEIARGLWTGESDAVRDGLLDLAATDQLEEALGATVRSVVAGPRLGPDLFVWSVRRVLEGERGPMFSSVEELSPLELFNRILDLLDHLALRSEREPTPHLSQLLTRARALISHNSYHPFRAALHGIGKDRGRELYLRIRDSQGISDALRVDLLEITTKSMPELTKPKHTPVWEEDSIYVTPGGLERRQDELRELMEDRLPQIFEDIGRAAAFGDLRENAEYKAALEQRDFLTRKATEIREGLDRAKLITPEMLKDDEVTLGSKVRLESLDTGNTVEYRILGPWDGSPDEGILNYHSPIARSFLGAHVGSEITVKLPGGTERFRVLSIESGIENSPG